MMNTFLVVFLLLTLRSCMMPARFAPSGRQYNPHKLVGLLGVIALLSGCANPYATYYHGLENAKAIPNYVPSTQPLVIYSTDNFARDIASLQSKGFVVIGNSSFNANSNVVSERQVRSQAEKLDAAVVLISSKYTNTVTGAMPLMLPNNTTSYSTGSATAYGPGGTVNAYGSGTTTTYGTQAVMMPYSVNRSDFGAIYFARIKVRFGVFVEPIDDTTKKRLESNLGARVRVIVEGSPAYLAGILPGDILLQYGGEDVISAEQFSKLLVPKYSGSFTVRLDRDGKKVEKTVTIN